MSMKQKMDDVKQPTRKKLWWLIFLLPILYVIVDGLIYPIDESALLKRTTVIELEDMAVEVERDYEMEEAEPSEPPPEPENGNGWAVYDKIWIRVEKAWPLLLSLLAFLTKRKVVGDHK